MCLPALLGIVLIWRVIRFRLYIPPQYIPDELINLSYYSDLIKGAIQGGIRSMGYVAPYTELIVNSTNMVLDLVLSISVVLGVLLLYAGFRELKALSMEPNKLTLIFGSFFVISLAALAATAFIIGLPFILDAKSLLVAWAFIFLNILYITKRKESGI
jgi:hypothetical protein